MSSWGNTELASDDLLKTVQDLRRTDGTDIAIFGSGSIVRQLMAASLIDRMVVVITTDCAGRRHGTIYG